MNHPKRKLVDEKCFDLATHFLSVPGHGLTFPPEKPNEVIALAAEFQTVAEDFLDAKDRAESERAEARRDPRQTSLLP